MDLKTFVNFLTAQSPVVAAGVFFVLALVVGLALPDERKTCGWLTRLFLVAVLALLCGILFAAFDFPQAALVARAIGIVGQGAALIWLIGTALLRGLAPRVGLSTPRIVQDVVTGVALLVWGLWCLRDQGVNITGVIATSAVLTGVIGFAMQDTLGNLLAGVALQLDGSLQQGDWLRIDDVVGRVVETRWRYTAIETRNWETVMVPNSLLTKGKFLVLGRRQGHPVQWRRWVWFNVDYAHPPQQVIDAVEGNLRGVQFATVATQPAPNCICMEFAESYCRYAVRYWLTDLACDDPTDSEVRLHIASALQRANIRFAFPAHRILMTEENEERASARRSKKTARGIAALVQIELFRHFEPAERQHLAERLLPAPFIAGDVMTRQGAEAHWLYLIADGKADVVVENAGRSQKVAELGPGSYFGEMSLMTGEPRTATVIARSTVNAWRLDKDAFQDILRSRPIVAEQISAILARRRTELDVTLGHLDAAARAARLNTEQSNILSKIRNLFGLV